MPRIVKLQSENAETEYLPPTFYLKFSQEEFPKFLANPTTTMKELGQTVKNLTVIVKDHVWDAGKQEWITQPDEHFAADGGLPPATQWQWWCGYQDEMCVCEAVIVP